MTKKKVAFICVHNSCRSQIAEALGKHLRGDEFDFYSAGTQTKPQINQDAVRLMKQLYGIDMEQAQFSKTVDKIPAPDMAISMGCEVGCPYIGRDLTATGKFLIPQVKAMRGSWKQSSILKNISLLCKLQ